MLLIPANYSTSPERARVVLGIDEHYIKESDRKRFGLHERSAGGDWKRAVPQGEKGCAKAPIQNHDVVNEGIVVDEDGGRADVDGKHHHDDISRLTLRRDCP